MSSSDIRVGLGPAGLPAMRGAGDRGRFVDYVRRAEQLGYASICAGDHLDDRGAPLALLAAAAVATDRITLATHVICNEWRNPAVLAQEARTVQVLSDGRLELGLGLGWLERDFETAGLAMAPFATRLDRLRATVERVRATSGARDLAAPTIVLGGGGPSMLRAAAGLADIVTLNIPLRSSAGLAANTCEGTKLPKVQRKQIVPLTTEQVAAVRDALPPNYRRSSRWRRVPECDRANASG